VSATESEQKFEPNVSGTRIAGPSTLWQLTGSTLDATDRVGQPPQVEIKEVPIDGGRSLVNRNSSPPSNVTPAVT